MKTNLLQSILTFIMITALLTGCDIFDKADDVSFTAPIEGKINIVAPIGFTSVSQDLSLNTASSPEIDKYKNKIKSITINKLTYTIVDYVGAADCTFFGSVSTSIGNTSISLTNINLKQLNDAGTASELTLPANDLKLIAAVFKQGQDVVISVDGTLSKVPTSFTIKFSMDAKIEADALK